MSEFSENLRSLITGSGSTIYKLAKDTGLERTLIHKALNDERTPSDEFVTKISDALMLTPSERLELQRNHEIRKIGVFRYHQRNQVKQLIELIAQAENDAKVFDRGAPPPPSGSFSFSDISGDTDKVYCGQFAVSNVVKSVVELESQRGENAKIDFIVPARFSFFYEVLSINYMRNPSLHIRHVIALAKKLPHSGQGNANIAALANVLRLTYSGGDGYSPRFYYTDADHYHDMAPMPYFILTSTQLVTLSAEMDAAVLYCNGDIIRLYANLFEAAAKQGTPLLKRMNNIYEIISYYLTLQRKAGGETSCLIGPQPCLGHYITEELTEKKLIAELDQREEVKALIAKHFENMRRVAIADMGLFSIAGMEYLDETGYMTDVPSSYAYPLEHGETRDLMAHYIADIKKGRFSSFAINPSKLTVPLFTTILTDKPGGVHFLTYTATDFKAIFINEPSIVEAFGDFCDSIEKSDLVYSREETLRILESFVDRPAR